MITIPDLPGRITVAEMRTEFEKLVNAIPHLKGNTPLGTMVINDKFSHYMDPDTDTMWMGFALGMRHAERLQKAATQ